ncbi:MAG: hypothetical protein RL701_559 [Pseudomonadota bacterium]
MIRRLAEITPFMRTSAAPASYRLVTTAPSIT